MADNTVINAGTGGDTIATDDIGGIKYQRVKVTFGADGAATDVATAAPLPTTSTCGTATLTNVAGSATSVSLLAANTARRQVIIWNDSTALLYVKFGATASTTSFTFQVVGGGYLELPMPVYTGAIDGIWVTATGSARITELT